MFRRCCPAFLLLILLLLLPPAAGAEAVAPWDREHPEVLLEAHLYSEAAILIDGNTGEALFSKDASAQMYPASTTKIMTLLLALESEIPLEETVVIPKEAADVPAGSSLVPVQPGEKMPFKDLLYGFMMRSGNDGANAIAVLVSGNVEAFVARMNQRAADLGCENTHFVNPHGYHDKNHYSTAADLALITREALRNPAFREIVAAVKYTMAPTSQRGALEVTTRNELINPESKYYYPEAIGVKTGYHSKAGQCLVAAAVRDGKLLICAVLNSDSEHETYKWYDAGRLFEYGWSQYALYTFDQLCAAAPDGLLSVPLAGAAADDPAGGQLPLALSGVADDGFRLMVRGGDDAAAEAMRQLWAGAELTLREDLRAPVEAGEAVGRFACAGPGGGMVTAALVAARAVAAEPTPAPTPVPAPEPGLKAEAEAAPPRATRGLERLEILLALAGVAAAIAVVALSVAQARENARRRRAKRRRARRKRSAVDL